ncbi:hypothetical protein MUP77_24540 [Candidatus Bathyarchaeota archaeon]|nr:hypothetical protein [Candidatus Bathyarchaeota archaeon]
MMMTMLSPKEERLLLAAGIIVLLCIPVSVLSLVSNSLTLSNYGKIGIPGREYPSSTFTYRIFQNSTSTYRINSTGFVDDHYGDPAVVINNALWNCSAAGGGSIYVYPGTYLTNTPIGSNALYDNWFSNVYLQLGDGTIIKRRSMGGDPLGDNMFILYNPLINPTDGTINFTLTSNGTAYFDAQGYACGAKIYTVYNSTFSNITWQHLYGEGIQCSRARYCVFENISVYSYDQSYADQGMFTGGCIQYCNFTNINLDGNNQALSRCGFYFDDNDAITRGSTVFDTSYFNRVTKLWVHNVRRSGVYLTGSETDGVYPTHVPYNNTFTNCTMENNWQSAYEAIKLRPAINNTFTNIVINNFTDAVTTGTNYDPGPYGNCTGNYVQATIYGGTVTSLILTTDGNNQEVSGNIFNLTVENGTGTYFASATNSPIKNNVVYMNFTNCVKAIYLDSGYFTNNTFYLNFTNCGSGGHSDIYHYAAGWTSMVNNTFNVYATSGNPNGLMDFVNGTQGNIVVYPYTAP